MTTFVRLDYPSLVCDRCGAQEPIRLPLTANALVEQINAFRAQHLRCEAPHE